jgi:hypothetical protein
MAPGSEASNPAPTRAPGPARGAAASPGQRRSSYGQQQAPHPKPAPTSAPTAGRGARQIALKPPSTSADARQPSLRAHSRQPAIHPPSTPPEAHRQRCDLEVGAAFGLATYDAGQPPPQYCRPAVFRGPSVWGSPEARRPLLSAYLAPLDSLMSTLEDLAVAWGKGRQSTPLARLPSPPGPKQTWCSPREPGDRSSRGT